MPKKGKKGKGKKGKKDKAEEVPEVTEWDTKTLEEMEEDRKVLQEAIVDARMKRNYFEQERDMIQQFYDIVHQDVVDTQAKIRNTESEMERMQDAHRNDIRIYVQKVKHLEYEHKNNLAAVAQEGEKLRSNETEIHLERRNALKATKEGLRTEMKTIEDANQDEIRLMKELQAKELVTLRLDFGASMKELSAKYEKRLDELKEDLELRRKMEIHEIEERKNLHINKLVSNHEKAFQEIKEYYYEITKDNLDLIKSLNDEYAELKSQEQKSAKKRAEIEAQNKTLSAPLAETEKEVADLKHKLQHYEKDKDSLRIIKARLLVLDEQYRTLTSEYDQLQRKFGTVQHERDMLQETFEQTLEWVRQRNAQSHQRIQERLEDVQGRVEQKSAQLSEVMRAGQLDEVVLRNVTDKLESVLTAKNQHNKHLQLEVARVQKAHDDLIRTYEARLVDLGIPESERNILAPRTNLTAAPAGLI